MTHGGHVVVEYSGCDCAAVKINVNTIKTNKTLKNLISSKQFRFKLSIYFREISIQKSIQNAISFI